MGSSPSKGTSASNKKKKSFPVPHRKFTQKEINKNLNKEKNNNAVIDDRRLHKLNHKKKSKLAFDLLKNASPFMKRLIRGDLSVKCPSTFKTVRVFVSSTFTDTQHERNWLMEKVYPGLREYCQGQGYDFQVVDMRWGIRDVSQDDHTTTEICLQEVDLCKEQSTGPCFISLMSHKYGYRDFPRKILDKDFEKLLDSMEDEDIKHELLRWFKKDENEVPPKYILQPISCNIPDAKSQEPEIRNVAMAKWNAIKLKIHSALASVASKVLSEEAAEIYRRSVSEAETMCCLHDIPKEKVLWYRRIINDIEKVDVKNEAPILRRFKDFTNDPVKDNEAKQLLQQLQDTKMKTKLSQSNIKEYKVQWEPGKGIDPDKNKSHKQYLSQLCTDAEKQMKSLIESAFSSREESEEGNQLYHEVLQHMTFCQAKCKAFHGRNDSLKKVQDYLEGPSDAPFVIHGPSGCGKTSLMAKTVQLADTIFGGSTSIVFRFLGTTPGSSNLLNLLTSLITQINLATDAEVQNLSHMTFKQLLSHFTDILKESRSQPLVLVLDSLDQLDPSHEARQMNWLHMKLAKNVKVVVSTLPEEQYSIFPVLQDKLKEQTSNFLAVPCLSNADIVDILGKWLEAEGRTLTEFQRESLTNSFQGCPLPLYLKLSFDQACQWKSYQPQDLTVLQATVRGCIEELFNKMEAVHGKIFVSRALGYLTASQTGLSETELEDILSCDEEVLDDVYRFWTPPLRRLPPFLLIQLKRSLGQYIVHRGSDGKQVFYWYHRQFVEASRDRYCSDPGVLKRLHQGLAEYFAGSWAEGRCKPYSDKDRAEKSADRYVASQPISFGAEFNERKLNRQAYHRAMAGQLELLKSECLMDYKFVTSKLECGGLQRLLDEFRLARILFPEDEELIVVSESLQLSQNALAYDLKTFPSQMLGRIRNPKIQNLPAVSTFLADCRNADHTYLKPDRPILIPAGGQLVHTIAEQKSPISRLLLNKAGTVAITYNESDTLKTFDVQEGKLLKSVEGIGGWKSSISLACKDSLIVINGSETISAYDINTASQKWTLKTEWQSHFAIGGEDGSIVVVFERNSYGFYKAETGQPLGQRLQVENIPEINSGGILRFSEYGPSVGSEKYAVTCDSDHDNAFLFELKSQTLIKHGKLWKFENHNIDGEKTHCKIEVMEISHDGKILFVMEDYDENIYLIHIETLETYRAFNVHKPIHLDNLHSSLDGQFIFFPQYNSVRVWQLTTGKKATLFHHLSSNQIEDAVSSDMKTFVASCSDRTVKIFDLSRGDAPGIVFEEDNADASKMNDTNVEMCQPTDHPQLFLVVWDVFEVGNREQILALVNASTSAILKKYHHNYEDHLDGRMTRVRYLNDWQIMVQTRRRIRILDLKSMKTVTTLDAVLPYYCNDVVSVNNGKEIAIVAKEDNNLKIMDISTGKVNAVLKKNPDLRILRIITNDNGTTLVASCEGPFLVFNVAKRICTHTIEAAETKCSEDDYTLLSAHISSDDTYLILLARCLMEDHDSQRVDVASIRVFNLKKKSHERELVDPELNSQSITQRQRYRSFKMIDTTRLISNHEDFILRIFNFQTGNLLQRLEGHRSLAEILYMPGHPMFLTHSRNSEENAIRLWDITNFECLAVLSFDYDMRECHMVEAGQWRVMAFFGSSKTMQPVVFSLQGKGSERMNPSNLIATSKAYPHFEPDGDAQLELRNPHGYSSTQTGHRASMASVNSDDQKFDDRQSMTFDFGRDKCDDLRSMSDMDSDCYSVCSPAYNHGGDNRSGSSSDYDTGSDNRSRSRDFDHRPGSDFFDDRSTYADMATILKAARERNNQR